MKKIPEVPRRNKNQVNSWHQKHHKQSAFTLIELLITITLSLIFLLGAIMFISSTRTVQTIQEASSRTQENARFAMDDLSTSIRMAGFYNELYFGNLIPPGQFYLGRCGDFDPCTADGTSAETYRSDRIAILVNPPEDDGSDEDCAGHLLSTDPIIAANSVVINLYRIEKGEPFNTLVCDSYLLDSNGNTTQINQEPYELVTGIDSMQLLYGASNTETAGQTNFSLTRYLSATTIDKLDPPVGSESAWINISSVSIALLVGSGSEDKAIYDSEQTHQLLDEMPITMQDNLYRKVYTATVQINNARL